jgi:hypothetical protein
MDTAPPAPNPLLLWRDASLEAAHTPLLAALVTLLLTEVDRRSSWAAAPSSRSLVSWMKSTWAPTSCTPTWLLVYCQ